MAATNQTVVVAAGVLLNKDRTHVLLSFRHAGQDQGQLWEYPGGKVEKGELPESALSRELKEELGITPQSSFLLDVVVHDYGAKKVELHFYVVPSFVGEPQALEKQLFEWHAVNELSSVAFPEANQAIAAKLVRWLANNV
mgnify:CR=1 FL=1